MNYVFGRCAVRAVHHMMMICEVGSGRGEMLARASYERMFSHDANPFGREGIRANHRLESG
jgi:hypothetical protein